MLNVKVNYMIGTYVSEMSAVIVATQSVVAFVGSAEFKVILSGLDPAIVSAVRKPTNTVVGSPCSATLFVKMRAGLESQSRVALFQLNA
jgi:hypothetical protein